MSTGDRDPKAVLTEIVNLAFHHGIRTVGSIDVATASTEERTSFIRACHDGFRQAQDQLVRSLLGLESAQHRAKEARRQARRERNREVSEHLSHFLDYLSHQIAVLRSIANGMAWVLCGDQRWIIRQLYQAETPVPLSSSNLSSLLEVTEHIHEDPLKFALISDLTTCVQIGDLLVADRNSGSSSLGIHEVKEGEMNEVILDFLDSWNKDSTVNDIANFANMYGTKALDQSERMVKQMMRSHQVMEVLRNDKGTDRKTGEYIEILEPNFDEEDYDLILHALIEDARTNDLGMTCIDGCLYVAAFRRDNLRFPNLFFRHNVRCMQGVEGECHLPERPEQVTKETLSLEFLPYPVMNVIDTIKMPVARPLFVRDLPVSNIVDIVMGEIIVFVYIDWEAYFTLAESFGLPVRWATKKERNQLNYPHDAFFNHIGKLPVIETSTVLFPIFDGVVIKMLDGLMPSTTLRQLQGLIAHASRADDAPDDS